MSNLTDEQIVKLVERLEVCADDVYKKGPFNDAHETFAVIMSIAKDLKSSLPGMQPLAPGCVLKVTYGVAGKLSEFCVWVKLGASMNARCALITIPGGHGLFCFEDLGWCETVGDLKKAIKEAPSRGECWSRLVDIEYVAPNLAEFYRNPPV